MVNSVVANKEIEGRVSDASPISAHPRLPSTFTNKPSRAYPEAQPENADADILVFAKQVLWDKPYGFLPS